MNQSNFLVVVDKEGRRGKLQSASAQLDALPELALIQLEDGQQIQAPKEVLSEQKDGSFFVPLRFEDLEKAQSFDNAAETITVPVIAEELQVGTRVVETGAVRFNKTVTEREEVVDEPLLRREVVVDRVAVNRLCEGAAPGIRHEGDVMIIPVLEEVLVVEKRLMLKEELHIRQVESAFHTPQRITLRREEIAVERAAASGNAASSEPPVD